MLPQVLHRPPTKTDGSLQERNPHVNPVRLSRGPGCLVGFISALLPPWDARGRKQGQEEHLPIS